MPWNEPWVWLADQTPRPQTTVLLRRVFDLSRTPSQATIEITASHIYRLYVNGEMVGRGPDRCDPRFMYFDRYDIAARLRQGRNVVVIVGHHQNTVPMADGRTRAWCLYGGPPGVSARISAGELRLGTDDQWRIRPAPGWIEHTRRISYFTAYQHHVDPAVFAEALSQAHTGEDDGNWQTPRTWPAPQSGMLASPMPRPTPMLDRVERAPLRLGSIAPRHDAVGKINGAVHHRPDHPLILNPAEEGAWLTFDFGRPMGGFPSIVLDAQGRGTVDIYTGESGHWLMTDRLHLSRGSLSFEPLDWRGGRYLALHATGLDGPLAVRHIAFVEMVYPFEPRGDFRASDETLTRLWRICRETVHAGVKDHPVDCLTREQALWVSDINVHARALHAAFGDAACMDKAIRQIFAVMHDDGVTPVPGPCGVGYQRSEKTLPWSEQPMTLAMTLRDLYMLTGSTELCRDAMPKLERMMAHFRRYRDARGLLQVSPPGLPALVCFGGWAIMLKDGVPTALNAEYALCLDAAADVAEAVGRPDLAMDFRQDAAVVRDQLVRLFWDPARKLFVDGESKGVRVDDVSLTPNAWAALAGAVPMQDRGGWAEALFTDTRILPCNSPYDATLLLDALVQLRLPRHVRQLLDDYFGSIVRANQPTLPEFWTAGDATSIKLEGDLSSCHPYGAGPAYLLQQHVLGVRPVTAGYAKTLIAPQPMGLSWARGRVPTSHGEIEVDWDRTDHQWTVSVSIPQGIEARVELPRGDAVRSHLVLDGRLVWRSDAKADTDHRYRRTAANPSDLLTTWTLDGPCRHTLVLTGAAP